METTKHYWYLLVPTASANCQGAVNHNFRDRPMWIKHETIHKCLYIQKDSRHNVCVYIYIIMYIYIYMCFYIYIFTFIYISIHLICIYIIYIYILYLYIFIYLFIMITSPPKEHISRSRGSRQRVVVQLWKTSPQAIFNVHQFYHALIGEPPRCTGLALAEFGPWQTSDQTSVTSCVKVWWVHGHFWWRWVIHGHPLRQVWTVPTVSRKKNDLLPKSLLMLFRTLDRNPIYYVNRSPRLGRWLSPPPLYSILFLVSSAALNSTYGLHNVVYICRTYSSW